MEHNRKYCYLPEFDTRIQAADKENVDVAVMAYIKYRMSQFYLLVLSNAFLVGFIIFQIVIRTPFVIAVVSTLLVWITLLSMVVIISRIVGTSWFSYKKNKKFTESETEKLKLWAKKTNMSERLKKIRKHVFDQKTMEYEDNGWLKLKQ